MIDAMGIILSSDATIPPLTDIRSIQALQMAGRYRLIDFILSNLANAGISNVGVATASNYSSLMDHVRSGKPWDLDRKNQGLNFLPPNMLKAKDMIKGDLDILEGIYDYITKSHQEYVILSLGTNLYSVDFRKVLAAHVESQADITVMYKDMTGEPESELSRFTLLELDADKRVTDMEVMPFYPKTAIAGMDVYVMDRHLLLSIIDECSARGDHDFIKDAIIKKLGAMRVFGYEYTGYTDKIDSLKSYYKNNMLFLNADMRKEMFNKKNPVYTKPKDQTPTKYGDEAITENSLIADGCQIEGTVINSILFRGVKVEKGAVVKNSIIMQDCIIQKDVYLDGIVFDKEVEITEGRKLIGQQSYPLAIAKGSII